MLTGQIKSFNKIPDKDVRKILPRFESQNFETNMKLLNELEKIAEEENCTSAQLALCWLRSLSKRSEMLEIVPILVATMVELEKVNSIEMTEAEMKDSGSIPRRLSSDWRQIPCGRHGVCKWLKFSKKSPNYIHVLRHVV